MPSFLKSRRVHAAISIVLAVGLLAFFLYRVPLPEIGRQIAAASPGWLAPSFALSLLVFVLWTTS